MTDEQILLDTLEHFVIDFEQEVKDEAKDSRVKGDQFAVYFHEFNKAYYHFLLDR